MPEHDEIDAPEYEHFICGAPDCAEAATVGVRVGQWLTPMCDEHARRTFEQRPSKVERWKVEDKVVDGESK